MEEQLQVSLYSTTQTLLNICPTALSVVTLIIKRCIFWTNFNHFFLWAINTLCFELLATHRLISEKSQRGLWKISHTMLLCFVAQNRCWLKNSTQHHVHRCQSRSLKLSRARNKGPFAAGRGRSFGKHKPHADKDCNNDSGVSGFQLIVSYDISLW